MIRLSTVYSRKRNKKKEELLFGESGQTFRFSLSLSPSIVSLSLSHIDRSSSPAVLGALLGETERFDPYVPFYFLSGKSSSAFASKMSHVRFPDRKPIVCYSPRPKSAQVYIVRLEKNNWEKPVRTYHENTKRTAHREKKAYAQMSMALVDWCPDISLTFLSFGVFQYPELSPHRALFPRFPKPRKGKINLQKNTLCRPVGRPVPLGAPPPRGCPAQPGEGDRRAEEVGKVSRNAINLLLN